MPMKRVRSSTNSAKILLRPFLINVSRSITNAILKKSKETFEEIISQNVPEKFL